jgi:hypothetical protein
MIKLPFWRTLGDAFRFAFTRPLAVLRALWLVYGLILLATLWFATVTTLSPGLTILAALAAIFVFVPAWIAAIVALHRSVLFGESSWGAAARFGERQWVFFGKSLLIGLLGGLLATIVAAVLIGPWLALYVPWRADGAAPGIGTIALFFVTVIILVTAAVQLLLGRLVLALPATAADDPNRSLRAAWRRTRRNTWRMFWGALLSWAPFNIVTRIIGAALPPASRS